MKSLEERVKRLELLCLKANGEIRELNQQMNEVAHLLVRHGKNLRDLIDHAREDGGLALRAFLRTHPEVLADIDRAEAILGHSIVPPARKSGDTSSGSA